jgi:hypothetical protein
MDKREKEKVNWRYYTRDDEYVKDKFLNKDFDTIETTGIGNFDGLFAFLLYINFFSLFDFRPSCRKRVMIPLIYLLSTYSLKVILRISSLNRIDSFLFKDRALLEMIGFTGVHFEEGFSRRNKGKHLPFNVSTLGKLIGDFSLSQTDTIFTNSLKLLSKNGFIKKGVFAIDSTPLYVSYASTDYENTGEIIKDGKKRKGYKLITLKYVGRVKEKEGKEEGPGIFVSGIVVPLNESENKYLIPLIKKAIKNIGEGKIKMVVADRGFFSGNNLWELKRKFGIDFLIYSKSNMDVTKELKIKMKEYQERKKNKVPLPSDYFYQEDEENTIYGFNNLCWFWTYGDKTHQEDIKKKLYKKEKQFKTHPIAGAIITRYKGKKGKTITLLSSKKFSGSFTPLDAVKIYKKRHHIENEGFRELKQGYKINRFPSRKFSGVYFHIIFTLLIYNFINCFKTEKGDKLAGIGLIRLHDEISWYGVVIYAYPHFGIFEIKEIAEWFGYKGKGMRGPPVLIF